ncbi:aspartyl-phosphate phosphatase Spo0E family protein [Neobacillus massiliamazoniensis]|uniref:Negative regulatory phosphatase acting on Spo0A-P n=1 Tax=Neobacillus massiliamazoniensis TaxID=1499688 RepID=A0A0U1NRL9_9BACI|nr:aspartyl-phosphate phosphatase Spo0E family protein [Neobacillus massiliamazoniensis]CRK80691.1 negative regulatory phosphatase acting on Spo0A-P [Neobacillus massiliamazoniensis]
MYKYSNHYRTEVLEEIKEKRELMISCANQLGFTNEKTIQYSQELDELINEYQRLFKHSPRENEEVKFAFKQMIMVWPKAFLEL